MQTLWRLSDDILVTLHERLDSATREALATTCKSIYNAIIAHVRVMRKQCSPLASAHRVLIHHFEDCRKVHCQGLTNTFQDILESASLSTNDILCLESLSCARRHEHFLVDNGTLSPASKEAVRDVALCTYEHLSGLTSVVTIGSVVDALSHTAVRVYVAGRAHNLTLYLKWPSSTRKLLPRTRNGAFYSWGFAERVGGVGSFDATPLLTFGCFDTA